MGASIGITFSAVAGTQAGLGRTASGKTVIADRPEGVAGGQGLGCNGGELLAAALAGCFWNDLHYVAGSEGIDITVLSVAADIGLEGTPPRVQTAHIIAQLSGNSEDALDRIFQGATEASTIANSLTESLYITFERKTGDR